MAFLTPRRRFPRLALVTALCIVTYFWLSRNNSSPLGAGGGRQWEFVPSSYDWGKRPQRHQTDVATLARLPTGTPRQLPRIQHEFTEEELNSFHNQTQRARRDAVREAATRSWRTYREYAWGWDEVAPVTLGQKDTFAGWGATLVDSLDTLWIMGLKPEFREAVRYVAALDWNNATSKDCSLFETNIRYLGGLLSAYDLSREQVLLDKAIELGDMLHAGFDTPNHMPANSFLFGPAKEGKLEVSTNEATAALGSLSLEFTRLSQLTGEPMYYHAVDGVTRALERSQDSTNLPGMWPVFVDLKNTFFTGGTSFSLGAAADSAYEYFSKMHALLGGLEPAYEKLHKKAMGAAAKHLLFSPMVPDPFSESAPDILFSGTVLSNGDIIELQPQIQHLGCFTGGMFALGGRLFGQDEHVRIGERLARGCAWAYAAFPTGVMPELAEIMPCEKNSETKDRLQPCAWNETRWAEKERRARRLPKPFVSVTSAHYILRPEAIESVFILYRITGKPDLLDVAWQMFESIVKATETKFAYSAIEDVRAGGETAKMDSMESFWIAETLKYFYLIFSEPELISLDDYVFNTEAHPLRLPKPGDKLTREP